MVNKAIVAVCSLAAISLNRQPLINENRENDCESMMCKSERNSQHMPRAVMLVDSRARPVVPSLLGQCLSPTAYDSTKDLTFSHCTLLNYGIGESKGV
jgi:hypothetical protein